MVSDLLGFASSHFGVHVRAAGRARAAVKMRMCSHCWTEGETGSVLETSLSCGLPGSQAVQLCSERLKSGLMGAEAAPLSAIIRMLKNALAATSKIRPIQNLAVETPPSF